MKTKLSILLFCCAIIWAFNWIEGNTFIVPQFFPKPVYDFSENTITIEKIKLGRALFYDPILSKNNTISCASCHSQYNAFTHADHALSHGINDKIGFRNAPTLMNLAWQSSFMRDGAVNHLDVQSLAPISNLDEMGENINDVVKKLGKSSLYKSLFYAAYNDSNATGEHTLKALSQFMLTLVSSNSKYDSVMHKQSKFTKQEENGYLIFKNNCAACHTEPLFTNDKFMNNGLSIDTWLNDFGRYRVTQDTNDYLKFKVPSLRNIEFSFPYMHDGRFTKLSEVINHYNLGISKSSTLAQQLQKSIILSSNEKVDLIAFLLTLTDKTFLFNPEFSYPQKLFSNKSKD